MKKSMLVIIMFTFLLSGCLMPVTAPQPNQPEKISLEIWELPNNAQRGEKVSFKVKTVPQAQCQAGIIYWTFDTQKRIALDFPEVKSTEDGLCEWIWIVPMNIRSGFAEFRVAAVKGRNSRDLIPSQVCMVECPTPNP
jgi:hypothetical protein